MVASQLAKSLMIVGAASQQVTSKQVRVSVFLHFHGGFSADQNHAFNKDPEATAKAHRGSTLLL